MDGTDTASTGTRACNPADRLTRSLLGYGVLAAPVYIATGLIQAVTRRGFELTRHDLSLLANGHLGWIQVANLIVTGLMTIAAAVGVRRSWSGGYGGTWAALLLAVYGAGLIAAGVFIADPAFGFPPGTPHQPTAPTWHGLIHFAAAGIGFTAFIAASFVAAGRFARDHRLRWAIYSRLTGLLFLAGFIGIASGGTNPAAVLGFWAAVIAAWTWLAAVSLRLYRDTGQATL